MNFYFSRPFSSSPTASIEALPPEILLPIVTSLPGLDTLWDLLRASPNVWRLFNENTLSIIERILLSPKAILPPVVAEAVRAVILTRLKALPFRNLHEFQHQFVLKLFPVFPMISKTKDKLINIEPQVLSAAAPSVLVLRSIVATAYQISALSQACLSSYLERLRDISFRPMHCLDPNLSYTNSYGFGDEWVPAWDRVFEGTPAKVVGAGQPNWVEEMRAVRALWIIQLVGEVQCQRNTLDWPNDNVDKLKDMNSADMIDRIQYHEALQNSEEVTSLMYYIATLGEAKQDVYYRLPPPPPFVRWITASPNRNERFSKFLRYRRDGTSLSLRCLTDDHKWGRTEEALRQEAPGMLIYRRLNRPPTDTVGASPIEGVKFGSFRQLGFAFWDMWRIHLLGMHSG
ncbi:Ff.00g046970.m01.CDS01 [Fusarium sp. VM40]|nr:Ff.00g046970.m01.CDS01 [Fusarium sp. VM40]